MGYDEGAPTPQKGSIELAQHYFKQWSALESQRSTWLMDWRECAEFINPWNFRLSLSDTNKGARRASRIINNTAGWANKTQAAGMMSGITSPARPWFEMVTNDPDLNDNGPVREWLDLVTERLRRTFIASNIYEAFHNAYLNLGQYGTHTQVILEDEKDVIRAYVIPTGEYCLASSDREIVDTMYRKFRLTAKKMVQWFGFEKVSEAVREAYTRGNQFSEFDVLNVIEPNAEFVKGALGIPGKKFTGHYIEIGRQGGEEKANGFLRSDGFNENPAQAARWQVLGGNVYGVGPGLECIGDIKGLQQLERDKGKGVGKMIDPPMVGPSSMKNERVSIVQGAMNYVDNIQAGSLFRPALEIQPQAIAVTESSIDKHEARIKREYNADLWVAMTESEGGPQMTAREVAERHEEKLTILGPVMQSLDRELLSPCVNRSLGCVFRRGLLPPPPPELKRHGFSVNYISIVAQALKMVQNGSIESTVAFAGKLAAVNPEVMDNFDLDKTAREYATNAGMRAALFRDAKTVAQIRAQRAQSQQAEREADIAQKYAQGAQTLSQTPMGGDTALARLLPGGAMGGGQ